MDTTLDHHTAVLTGWFDTFVQHRNGKQDTNYELIIDERHGHFQVIRTGWRNDVFEYSVVLHFQLKPNGKIWILVNNTDLLVTDDLIDQGIPASDIVIGFLPEYMRSYSGFAVA